MDALDIPYTLNPHLVRGLDYYTRTVFEFVIQETTPEPRRIEAGGARKYNYIGKQDYYSVYFLSLSWSRTRHTSKIL